MRRGKRIISIVMVLTLVLCFCAMSASAMNTEIQPRVNCAQCGAPLSSFNIDTSETYTATDEIRWVDSCSKLSTGHVHYKYKIRTTRHCRTCGNIVDSSTRYAFLCPIE